MSRFDNDINEASIGSPQLQARLKWFNAIKGFGFVSPLDGSPDAFLHVSVLHRAGLQQINDDAEMTCEIGPGPKGPQVVRIVEITSQGTSSSLGSSHSSDMRPGRPTRPVYDDYQQSGTEQEANGTVKWFKADKGFGFITDDQSGQDVFVHKTVLQRSGIYGLEAGQRVQIRMHEVEKGREATWVSLL